MSRFGLQNSKPNKATSSVAQRAVRRRLARCSTARHTKTEESAAGPARSDRPHRALEPCRPDECAPLYTFKQSLTTSQWADGGSHWRFAPFLKMVSLSTRSDSSIPPCYTAVATGGLLHTWFAADCLLLLTRYPVTPPWAPPWLPWPGLDRVRCTSTWLAKTAPSRRLSHAFGALGALHTASAAAVVRRGDTPRVPAAHTA